MVALNTKFLTLIPEERGIEYKRLAVPSIPEKGGSSAQPEIVLPLGATNDAISAARGPGGGSSNGGGNGGGPPPGKGPGGGGEETSGNNLSFPVILAGGITLTELGGVTLTVPYTGPYTGLSAEELAIAQGDTWYAQKVTGNKWQADFKTLIASENAVPEYIDWGDNAESVNPKLGRPFRLEVTLYDQVGSPEIQEDGMNGYEMAVLAFPSSSKEVQGTNGETYESDWATVAAAGDTGPKLVVQHIEGATDLDLITWDAVQETSCKSFS
jgi:hypothetical protein